MALSRIGLWSFDLIQVKQLQLSVEEHPRRNTMYVVPPFGTIFLLLIYDAKLSPTHSTSLQLSLQNIADLLK